MMLYASLQSIDEYYDTVYATCVDIDGDVFEGELELIKTVDRNPYTGTPETWLYVGTPAGGATYVKPAALRYLWGAA